MSDDIEPMRDSGDYDRRFKRVKRPEVRGVWVTYYYAPYEGCSRIVPHASAEDAAKYLSSQSYPNDYIRFVPFGEELKP